MVVYANTVHNVKGISALHVLQEGSKSKEEFRRHSGRMYMDLNGNVEGLFIHFLLP